MYEKELKMLSVDICWDKIENDNCYWDNKLHNMQPIKEKLMRLACKWVDQYCTDLLIFFEYMENYFIKEKIKEIDFYFRCQGVDYVLLSYDNIIGDTAPKMYRGKAKLKFENSNMTLYWQIGNC